MPNNSVDGAYEQEIVRLVFKYAGIRAENIAATTTLREDLGLDGDDAEEFLAELSSRFNVNLDGFNFENYFLDEWSVSMKPILQLFKAKRLKNKIPIDVRHLIEAVSRGQWFDPPKT